MRKPATVQKPDHILNPYQDKITHRLSCFARYHAVGYRQVFPHRVPGLLRLLQPDVLDHLPAHQRRGSGRSGAARGGEVNERNARVARAQRWVRAVKETETETRKYKKQRVGQTVREQLARGTRKLVDGCCSTTGNGLK